MTELQLAQDAVAFCHELIIDLQEEEKELVNLAEEAIVSESNLGSSGQSLRQAIEALAAVMHKVAPQYIQPILTFPVQRSTAMLKNVNESHKIFKELGDKEGQLAAVCLLADVRLSMKETEKGLRFATKGLQLAEELSDKKAKASLFHTMTNAYLLKASSRPHNAEMSNQTAELKKQSEKNTSKALQLAKDAVKVFQEINDKKKEATARLIVAEIHLQKDQLESATESAIYAQSMYKEIGDKRGDAHAMHILVSVHMKKEEWDDAMQLAMDAVEIFTDAGDQKHKIEIMILRSQVEVMLGLPGRSLETSKECINMAKSMMDRPLQMRASQGAIGVYEAFDRFDEALSIANECLEITRRMQNEQSEAGALFTVARLTLAKACHDFEGKQEDADKTAEEEGRPRWTAVVKDPTGQGLAVFQSAAEMCTQAVELFRKYDDAFGEAMVMKALKDATTKMEAHYMSRVPPSSTIMKTDGTYKSTWNLPKSAGYPVEAR